MQTPPVEGPPIIPTVPPEKKTNKKLTIAGIIFVVLLLIFVVGGYFLNLRYQSSKLPSPEGLFCGGIAGNLPKNQCPSGYTCKLDGNYPDAGGTCAKQ